MSVLASRYADRLVLEQLRLGATTTVGANARLHVQEDPVRELGALTVRLESEVLAEKYATGEHTGTGHKDFPSSPWQFFKQRHAKTWWLGWLVERRPVGTERHYVQVKATVTSYAKYPHANVAIPELGRPVVFEQLTWNF